MAKKHKDKFINTIVIYKVAEHTARGVRKAGNHPTDKFHGLVRQKNKLYETQDMKPTEKY